MTGPDGPDAPVTPAEVEAVLDAFHRVRDQPPPSDASSAGCTAAIVAIVAVVLMPFIGRGFDLSGNVMAALGLALLVTALVVGLVGIFGGRGTGTLPGNVESAIEQLVAAHARDDVEPDPEAAIVVLQGAFTAPESPEELAYDPAEIGKRLGDALRYVERVERILIGRGEMDPVFTARS